MPRVSLQTFHNTYITFEQNTGLIAGNRTEVGDWEKLRLITDPSNPTHGWIEDSTGYNLLDMEVGPRRGTTDIQYYKYFGLWQRNGKLSIQSTRTGKWFRIGSAEEGFPVDFSADEPKEYETLTVDVLAEDPVEPGQPDYRQIKGQLAYDEGYRAFKDDNGFIHPCFVHLGDGFALFTKEKARMRSVLSKVRERHYTGTLSWSILNDVDESNPWHIPPYYWTGPKHTPNYWQEVKDYALLHKELGLVWLFVLGGLDNFSGMSEARDYINRFCDIADEVGPEVFAHETVNELHASSHSEWHDPDKIDELGDIVRSRHPRMIVMSSSLGGVEEAERLAPYNRKTKVVSHHQFRGFAIGNKADHPWTMGYATINAIRSMSGNPSLYRLWNTEPCGPFSDVDASYGPSKVKAYVSVQDNGHRSDNQFDDESLGLIAMKNYAGGLAFNFFSAPGVKLFDGADLDNYPGFKNIGKLIQMLPQDMWAWGHITKHGGNAGSLGFLGPVQDGRIDGLYAPDGSKAFLVSNGINNVHDRDWSYPVLRNCKVKMIHPGTLEVSEFTKHAGERIEFHSMWGRGFYFEAI